MGRYLLAPITTKVPITAVTVCRPGRGSSQVLPRQSITLLLPPPPRRRFLSPRLRLLRPPQATTIRRITMAGIPFLSRAITGGLLRRVSIMAATTSLIFDWALVGDFGGTT